MINKKQNNFCNSCVLELDEFPGKPCELGKLSFENKANLKNLEKSCPWFVNSEKHKFCFWVWIHENSDEHGKMPEFAYKEISNLLGLSNSAVGIILREGIVKIKEICEADSLDLSYVKEEINESSQDIVEKLMPDEDDF